MTKKTFDKYRQILSFALCAVMIFLFMEYRNITKYWWDSDEYRVLSLSFTAGGSFHFIPEVFTDRAYTWPLLYAALNGFGHFGVHVFRLLNSLMYSFMICIIMGNLFEELFKVRLSAVKRSIPAIMIIIFWPGLILYPLTDLIAVLTAMLSAYALIIMYRCDKFLYVFIISLISGFAADAALNMRATYKYSMYFGFFAIAIMAVRKKSIHFALSSLAGYLLGAGISAAPQIYANMVNYGIFGWDNPLSYWNGNNRAVYLLYEGLINPRIETYIGPGAGEWISPAVTSIDPITTAIFHREGLDMSVADQYGIIDYLFLLIKYPTRFIALYLSHFINCLDARYGIIYIEKFGGRFRSVLQLLSVITYEILIIDAYTRLRGRLDSIKGLKSLVVNPIVGLSCLLLLPVAISLPGHIEPRYAIALHVLMYTFIAYRVDYKRVLTWVKNHAVISIVFFAVMFACLTLIQDWSLGLSGYTEFMY